MSPSVRIESRATSRRRDAARHAVARCDTMATLAGKTPLELMKTEFGARLIEDLLTSTRIEAGQLQIRAQNSDLQSLLRDFAQLVTPVAAEKSVVVGS